jgi:quinol monooxygenase YgiN
MITRIVRMEFQPEHVDDFLVHFRTIAHLIRNFPGVRQLELHRDASQSNVFYTYSKWDGESELEIYRQSELFKTTWAQAKSWFAGNPRAYSLCEELVVNKE